MYLPKRYFSSLSKTKRQIRKRELTKRAKLSWKDPKAYRPFKTDVGVKTRKSKYVLDWKRRFPNVKSIEGASNIKNKFWDEVTSGLVVSGPGLCALRACVQLPSR